MPIFQFSIADNNCRFSVLFNAVLLLFDNSDLPVCRPNDWLTDWLIGHWCDFSIFGYLGRPYGVTGGHIKCSWCFFSTRELPRPTTAKLRHMITACVYFINWLQKFGEPSPQKIGGQKHAKFRSILYNRRLWPRISPERLKTFKYRKTNSLTAIPPALYEKGPVNFGPLITETKMWVRTH